jgi:mono/diheme cytochrome c family protein
MRFPTRGYAVVIVVGLAVTTALLWRSLFRPEDAAPPAPGTSDGRSLYQAHCATCHGPTGKGDGLGARIVRQPIKDFSDPVAMRALDDRFLFEIIKKGGSQFGRSNAMPSWGMQLTDDQIRAIVAHIRSLASEAPTAAAGRRGTP